MLPLSVMMVARPWGVTWCFDPVGPSDSGPSAGDAYCQWDPNHSGD